MEPGGLEQIVREEAAFVGMSTEFGQQDFVPLDDLLSAGLNEIVEKAPPGLPVGIGQDSVPTVEQEGNLSMLDLAAAALEIQQAIDEIHQGHPRIGYGLPMQSGYIFDPDYMVPIPGGPMPDPRCGP